MNLATRVLVSAGVHASAARTPRKIALRCADESVDYASLSVRIQRVTGGLQQAGLRHGECVALLAPNCIEYPEILLGIADAGGVAVTLNPRFTTAEILSASRDCSARWLFVHSACGEHELDRLATVFEKIIFIDQDYPSWRDASPLGTPDETLADTDPFTLVYSSGTTGKPKGITLSHRSRALTFHAMAMEYGCYGPDDYQLGIAPMAHGAGFAFIMASIFFGGSVDILPKFDPEQVLSKLRLEAFTGVFMVPTHYQNIFALPGSVLGRYRGGMPALRSIISNAAALPQHLKQKIVDYFGEGLLHETYGSTEAGIVTNLRPQYQLSKERSVGPAFALNHIQLLNDAGEPVAPGEVGELYSRSPYLFNGYWNQPEETAAVLRDGWLTAGDLAKVDEDGFFYIVDRKKDMVVSGGLNIYPREIEEVLAAHPAIKESAVIGIPDEQWGEALRAYVVLRADKHVSTQELDAHCRQVLAGYKVPRDYRYIGTLPRNAGGKVLKRELA
ncbi:MAG: class I adenylate-forming enzyme family protein [Steroidobacteraceae bacterium]